jgi:hypothetical protein
VSTHATRRWRVERGLALAAACVLLSGGAHAAAGGLVADPGAFLLVAALVCGGCVAWADRRREPAEILGVVLLSQPVLHTALISGGHDGHVVQALPEAPMVVAHALAAVALGLLLAGAEAVVWGSQARASVRLVAASALAALLAVTGPEGPRRAAVHPAALVASTGVADPAGRVRRRGPPRPG